MSTVFSVRKCINPACGLRFTWQIEDSSVRRCPVCHSDTVQVGDAFQQLDVPAQEIRLPRFPIEVLLDNIRSAWNVGSIFRACDGAGVRKVHLCGVSPLPDQNKVAKTALGAEKQVSWEYHPDGAQFCFAAAASGFAVWALEGGPRAENVYQLDCLPEQPLLLVLGNEVTGVDPGILTVCERVICLPMLGMKGSLNVAGAFTAAVYALRFGIKSGNGGGNSSDRSE